jgi:hypothetical protein
LGAAVRGPAKRAERFGFALNFFAPLFCFKTKKWKTSFKKNGKRVKLLTAMLRQAQHNKVSKTKTIAISLDPQE